MNQCDTVELVVPVDPTSPPESTTPGSVEPTSPPESTTPGSVEPTSPPESTTPGSVEPTSPPESTTPGQTDSTNSADSASPTTDPATTALPDVCELQPCPDGSQCEARANETRVCLCTAGESYNEDSQLCEAAKVFPGQLQVPGLAFVKDMEVKTSVAFQNAAQQITDQIALLFTEGSGYSRSIVLELKQIASKNVRAEPGVSASVEMIFRTSAPVKTQDIQKAISDASKCVDACFLAGSNFAETNLCEKKPCDEKTTTCTASDGEFLCKCSKGYIETDYSQLMCVACPSGQKSQGTLKCVNCPFGYSGFDCSESWKLVLVIVGSVLGGLLLITVIILIVVSTRSPKKTSPKKNKDSEDSRRKPDVIHFSDKDPLVTNLPTNQQESLVNIEPAMGVKPFPSGGIPRIPRATAASAWDSGTNMEMTSSNSRPGSEAQERRSWLNDNSEYTNDSPYSRPRNQTNPYGQTRPLSNPYSESRTLNNQHAQDRPQTNPYARSQGQNNPSFSHDNERPFNY
ncbi:mucin-13b [Vanacampus margaritifer]